MRWENPPEGAKNLQECSRNTGEHNTQLGCTGFHRNSQDLDLIYKGVALSRETQREREGRGGEEAAHREERSTGEVAGGSPLVKGDRR